MFRDQKKNKKKQGQRKEQAWPCWACSTSASIEEKPVSSFHEPGRYQQRVLHGVYPWSFAAKALWHAETFRCSQRNKDNSHATRSRSVLKSMSICLNDDACWHFHMSLEHRTHHARIMHSSRERAHAHRHVQIHNMLIHYRLVCSCLLRCAFATDIVTFPQLGFSKQF